VIIQENKSTSVVIDGTTYVYFGGTNYLGLAHRRELLDAATEAFQRYGFSAGAARSTSGESDQLLQLESDLAFFSRSEAAIVLSAGYMSNFAVVDALENLVDAWLIQDYAHGSIRSALSQSRKPIVTFRTLPRVDSIREGLGLGPNTRLGTFVEPINPMTGEVTNIRPFAGATGEADFLILDEAHSIGVLGRNGRGVVEHLDLQQKANVIITGTFSKAIGTMGGFVVAREGIIRRIKENSNCYKASTPLSPVAVAATREALRLIVDDHAGTLGRLKHNISLVNDGLAKLGYKKFAENVAPIFMLPRSPRCAEVQQHIRQAGLYLPAVGSYFSQNGSPTRWTVQAGHTDEELRQLISLIPEPAAL
jgi:8-amino-7-oxononanoate synthase